MDLNLVYKLSYLLMAVMDKWDLKSDIDEETGTRVRAIVAMLVREVGEGEDGT